MKDTTSGSYAADFTFLKAHHLDPQELVSGDGQARVLFSPALQGRVMTSTAGGPEGDSYGWINYRYIAAGERSAQFNPFGGEERFWIGPEGGAFSYYFKPGAEQVYANWQVPAVLDTQVYEVEEQTAVSVRLRKDTVLENAGGVQFQIGLGRQLSLLTPQELGRRLGLDLPQGLKCVAYETANSLTNNGSQAWDKATGLPSIWLLGMFNPSPTTTVFIPYKEDAEGPVVNDTYFGKVPADRLVAKDGILRFKIDGKLRTKIGLPAPRALDLCGSYDSEKKVLTLLKFSLPQGPADYVNSQWGVQADPFHGDVINAYNDGPVEDGSIMGPFYEIESSSPGAALAPGQSLTHTQTVVHLQGPARVLAQIVKALFHCDLEEIAGTFR